MGVSHPLRAKVTPKYYVLCHFNNYSMGFLKANELMVSHTFSISVLIYLSTSGRCLSLSVVFIFMTCNSIVLLELLVPEYMFNFDTPALLCVDYLL